MSQPQPNVPAPTTPKVVFAGIPMMPHYTLTLSGRMTLLLIGSCLVIGFLVGRFIS